MKTVLDSATRDALVARIRLLNENSTAQWGKMTIYQALKHCVLCEEMYLGRKSYKRAFIGRLFGKMSLNNLLKDESPMPRNAPTGPEFKITGGSGDIALEKEKWIALINDYGHFQNTGFVHWFFGKMTREQVGYFAYKHADHHLRQFGC